MADDVDTRTLWECAFDYEREVIEDTEASDWARDKALCCLNKLILPLMGHVRMCDIDRQLEHGYAAVLWAQFDDYRPAHVWHDFLRVTRARYRARRLSS